MKKLIKEMELCGLNRNAVYQTKVCNPYKLMILIGMGYNEYRDAVDALNNELVNIHFQLIEEKKVSKFARYINETPAKMHSFFNSLYRNVPTLSTPLATLHKRRKILLAYRRYEVQK